METLAKMLVQQEELEVQIARTKRKIALLSQLCDETDTLAPIPDLDLGGLTEACRSVLRASRKEWMNTTEIMNGLRELGFPLDKYKAPMASVTTTVTRMVDSGDVIPSLKSNPGATEYKWVGWSGRSQEYRNFATLVELRKAITNAVESLTDPPKPDEVIINPPAPSSLAAMAADGRLTQPPRKGGLPPPPQIRPRPVTKRD
jgi:hypothetical protein